MNAYFKKILMCFYAKYIPVLQAQRNMIYILNVYFHERTAENQNTIECTDFLSEAVISTP